MIIDAILDRRDGEEYNGKSKNYMMESAEMYGMELLAEAFRSNSDYQIKKELINYLIENEYDIYLAHYILSVKWVDKE